MKNKGLLIVCEGLDCSGKTTAIEEIVNSDEKFVYSKGIGSKSFVGRTALKYPSTFMFFTELVYNNYRHIKPSLSKNKIVLQDRYDISITSFVPLVNQWYNQLFTKFFTPFITKPDAIVYFYLPINERIKRLKQKATPYEMSLAENPNLIIIREKEYEKWYQEFSGPKIRINTQENSIRETSKTLRRFVHDQYSNASFNSI